MEREFGCAYDYIPYAIRVSHIRKKIMNDGIKQQLEIYENNLLTDVFPSWFFFSTYA